MASAAQKRAHADLAAFVAKMGRRPRKGESIKGFAGGAAPARSSSSRKSATSSDDAAAAKRRRAAKRAAATRATWQYKAKKAVTNHPVRSALAGLVGVVAAVPRSRTAVAGGARRFLAVVRK